MRFSCNEKEVFKTQVNVTLWGDTADSFRVSMESERLHEKRTPAVSKSSVTLESDEAEVQRIVEGICDRG
jgi:hypothetical protein